MNVSVFASTPVFLRQQSLTLTSGAAPSGLLALSVLLVALGCGDRVQVPTAGTSKVKTDDRVALSEGTPPASAAPTAAAALLSPSHQAMQVLSSLRTEFSTVAPSVVDGFRRDAGGLRAQFTQASQRTSARVLFPNRATRPFEIEDVASGAFVKVALKGARDAEAQVAEDYVVYANAHDSGASLVHRASPSGTEDFLRFENRPASPSVAYQVTLGKGVSGLRLVANVLEMIDAGGAPRLRVEPPYILGADGVRTDARLAVRGCAVDKNPAGPWGRPVRPPGAAKCTVLVSWDDSGVEYPALLDPQWSTTTNTMVSLRQEHTATLMTNGKVLVAGGRNGTGTAGLASAELFDPATGSWAATNAMTGQRRLHTATQLNTGANANTSGKVLIAGGIDGAGSLTTSQLYSPSAGTWLAGATLNAARHQHTATLMGTGQVLIVGGMNGTTVLNTAAKYDPIPATVGSWTATTGTLSSARRAHTATRLVVPGNATLNNKIMVVGGNSGGTTSLNTVQFYDGTNWSAPVTATNLANTREGHTATALANGNVLITGGKSVATFLGTAFVFNAASGGGSWTQTGTMTALRHSHTATLLSSAIVANGQVLVAGGTSNGSTSLDTAELWNGTSWSLTNTLPARVHGHTATLLNSGKVLTAGGLNDATVVNFGRLYDPSFSLTCSMPSQCASGFCVDGVCCNTACNTNQCFACNVTGSVGVCSAKTNGASCNDSNACTQTDTCQAGTCTGANPKTCAASDQCHSVGTCNIATGVCSNPAKVDGTGCTDGNACTQTDTCQAGTCTGSNPKTCTASDQCHAVGTCNTTTGVCSNPAKVDGTGCTDGNACTQTDTCQAGTCTGANPKTCTVSDQCHAVGTCDTTTGVCSNPAKADGTGCTDGNACTQTDTCQAGTCTGANSKTCTASDQCHAVGTCDTTTGACSNPVTVNGTSCNDGNACTQSDTCQSGACTGGSPVACSGTGAGQSAPIGSAGGTVTLESAKVQIPAGALPTTRTITITSSTRPLPVGLVAYSPIFDFAPDGTQFSVAATVTFTIGLGAVNPIIYWSRPDGGYDDIGGTYANGQISAPVTHFSSGVVVRNNCQGATDGTTCFDGNLCTVSDQCAAGHCVRGTTVNCGPAEFCHKPGVCDINTGFCNSDPDHEGQSCDDGNRCTATSTCVKGTCLPGPATACSAPNDHVYARLVNLGSYQGQSFARDINNNHEVVGNDSIGFTSATWTFNPGHGEARGFRWTESGGLTYLISNTRGVFPMGINSTGAIAGTTASYDGLLGVFRAPALPVQPISIGGNGFDINDAGTITGDGYIGPAHTMYRVDLENTVTAAPLSSGQVYAAARAISPSGASVGFFIRTPDNRPVAARAVGTQPVEDLNSKLSAAERAEWDLADARGINATDVVVGWGYHNTQPRAYRLRLNAAGQSIGITDLGYAQTFPNDGYYTTPVAQGISPDGKQIVGAVYEASATYAGRAFVWVEGSGGGTAPDMVNLDEVVDPLSGWQLKTAFAINDSGEIVGWGLLNGVGRAFKMTLPGATACPLLSDPCRGPGVRHPVTAKCEYPALTGIACNDNNACTQGETCQAGTCGGGSAVVCAATQCQIAGVCNPASGCAAPTNRPAGETCDDGIACTHSDTCQAGVCRGIDVVCSGGDQCRAAGTCDPSTGACSHPALSDTVDLSGSGGPSNAPRSCDDGNHYTTGDRCVAGTCLPGQTTDPTQPFHSAVTNLGSANGESVAYDINDDGVVIGSDSRLIFQYSHSAQGFRWTASGGRVDLPHTNDFGSYPYSINSGGVVTGVVFTGAPGNEGIKAFRHAPLETLLRQFDPRAANGTGINDAGTITGNATFAAVRMYRTLGRPGDAFEELPAPAGAYSRGFAIDAAGNVYGDGVGATESVFKAARYHNTRGFEMLNGILPPLAPGDGWDLMQATGTNGRQIVGWGHRDNGTDRAFLINTNSDGSIADIRDLGITSQYAPNTTGNDVIAYDVNATGVVVGGVHDYTGTHPERAFVWADGTMHDLNDYVDPTSGWVLQVAYAINTPRDANNQPDPNKPPEVVGLGTLDGKYRAFKMKLPDVRPCPAIDDCHLPTPRNPATGQCDGTTPGGIVADGTACGSSSCCSGTSVCMAGVCGGGLAGSGGSQICLIADGKVEVSTGKFVAVFGYSSSATTGVVASVNQVKLDGTLVPFPQPTPPSWFAPGDHPGTYLPTFDAGQTISWQVNGQIVTSSALRTLTPLPGRTDIAVAIGEQIIVVKSDADKFAEPPPPPQVGDTPALGARFNGVLTGQLGVTPTGAATYSLPILVPPGIAGMQPNLSLVYNSQAGTGLAGQGWELSGLSIIHMCPLTRAQDGEVPPVNPNDFLTGTGICLDGKRLFGPDDQGLYVPEIKDFTTIKKSGEYFTVTTKSGETRFYGRSDKARVKAFGSTLTPVTIWALDRVVDPWGNYFDVTYNNNLGNPDFESRGLIVTEIKYTGHLASTQDPGSAQGTFHTITFDYDTGVRKDVRHLRLATWTLPRNKRLRSITTPMGVYTLAYKTGQTVTDDTMLPSQLASIEYCESLTAERACLKKLEFEWQGGGFSLVKNTNYELPKPIDRFWHSDDERFKTRGTQFVDLDGDGRPDFVKAVDNTPREAWHNNETACLTSPAPGCAFEPSNQWALPNNLVDSDGDPAGSILADMNGDGLLDFVTNSAEGAFCEGGNCPADKAPAIYLNQIRDGCPGGVCWAPKVGLAVLPSAWGNVDVLKDFIRDMDGDGRGDLVRIVKPKPIFENGHQVGTDKGDLLVLLNRGDHWVDGAQYSFAASTMLRGKIDGYHLEDINRDGLTDLVSNGIDPDRTYYVGLNTGAATGNVWRETSSPADPNHDAPPGTRVVGDISGDGFYDPVFFYRFGPQLAHGSPTGNYVVFKKPSVALGDGTGYLSLGAEGFLTALQNFGPDPALLTFPADAIPNYVLNMADLNADGLADLILNHSNGGQLLANTGTTWKDINGETQRQTSAGVNKIPFVPTELFLPGFQPVTPPGSTFVDLNGDGVADLVRALPGPNNGAIGEAYLNTFQPPVISKFTNGLARQTEVTYEVISSEQARLSSTYSDPEPIAPGTTALAVPLRVVANVKAEDGRGIGELATTRYQYQSLRGSSTGRGPQGFRKTIVIEPSDVYDAGYRTGTLGTATETTYSQIFPYTGMPVLVVKSKGSAILSGTITRYCDKISQTTADPACPDAEGPGETYAPGTTLQVYPRQVSDVAYPIGGSSGNVTTITSTFKYDTYGNASKVTVNTSRVDADAGNESYEKIIQNFYGDSDSDEQKQGKPIWTSVFTKRADGNFAGLSHNTAFEYMAGNGFVLDGQTYSFRVLTKTKVEPGTWIAEQPELPNQLELHTAYEYDAFGNVIKTTTCASDFDRCSAGGTNPSSGDPRFHPPFRTTIASYDPQLFNSPTGTPPLTTVLGYVEKGRFPVGIANAAAHLEYMAHHPVTGALIQRTGPNGIHTCYLHDGFGRQTAEINRCGSGHSLESTVRQHYSAGQVGGEYPVVTVTQAPTGVTTWAYGDVLGRAGRSLTRGLSGDLIETGRVTYNRVGQISTETKPRFDSPGTPSYSTTHKYDVLGPEKVTIQELGQIGDTGTTATSVFNRSFQGSTIITEEQVTGNDGLLHTRERKETKNSLGKVSKVVDDNGKAMRYTYDADGNLRNTFDPSGNLVNVTYDTRGRKIRTIDFDLGVWLYTYNGFGDLLEQKDGKEQVASMEYDRLGRVTKKVDASGSSEWIYDLAAHGQGKLAAMVGPADAKLNAPCSVDHATLTDGNRPARWFTYTANGDVDEAFECVDGTTFSTQYGYDATTGRQNLVRYPEVAGSRLSVVYNYTPFGHLQYLTEEGGNRILWAATEMSAMGQVTGERLRNGIETSFNRNPSTGWLLGSFSISPAQNGQVLQHWEYHYDQAGNLRWRGRSDTINMDPSQEIFGYDSLNRLTSSQVKIPSQGLQGYDETEIFQYDDIGNLTYKGGKSYTYSGCQAGPHAVCTVGESAPFVYDRNGNMTSGNERTVDYNASNKPVHIVSVPAVSHGNDTGTVDFIYGADGNRVMQKTETATGTTQTVYVGLGETGKSLYERTKKGETTVEHTQFIYAGGAHGGNAFAVRTTTTTTQNTVIAAPSLKYYHHDHLGSVTAISDEAGRVVDAIWGGGANATVMGYDAWGARRSPEGRPANPASFSPQVGHREFTGHEAIPNVGLVNMNGRVYDPVIGRFLTPDPTVQFIANLQSYNRYSYVLNNPLSYTDPTGYSVFSSGLDSFISFSLGFAAMVACAGPQGFACIGLIVAGAAWQATTMKMDGASWEQAITLSAVGLAVGLGSGEALNAAKAGPLARIMWGGATGAYMGVISTAVMGGSLGENVLMGAAHGAMSAVQSMILGGAVVSLASAWKVQGNVTPAGLTWRQRYMELTKLITIDPFANSETVPLADNSLSDIVDAIKGFMGLRSGCSAGLCSDTQLRILSFSETNVSVGVQGEVTLSLPKFFNGGFGKVGFNLQLNLAGINESGAFLYVPGPDTRGSGFNIGADVGFNLAVGSGPWSGAFNNYDLGVGPLSLGAFRSPGWTGEGPGWAGGSLGVGVSWKSLPGFSKTQVNFIPLNGQQ